MLDLFFAGLWSSAQQPSTSSPAKPSAGTASASSSLPSEATFDAFLKKMFGYDQNLTWKIVEIKPSEAAGVAQLTALFNTPQGQQVMRLYVTQDQKFAFVGDLLPFGTDPFARAREDLKAANGPTRGPKDATLTIVEFGDLQCPACKAAQPNINKLMQEEPKARLIFENFPLENIHKWAMTGAKYVDCLGRSNNDVAWKFIDIVYEHQAEITEENVSQILNGYVKDAGGDPTAVTACATQPETEKRVRESMALGEKLGITSTPTFFIDGRRLQGFGNNVPYEIVKQMTDYYISNAGK
jgi:protein-disulfide isomerase